MQEKFKIQSRKVYFAGFDGNQLAASFDFPGIMTSSGLSTPPVSAQVFPKQYVIVSHCFTCTRQTLTTARLSRGLAQAGYGVLRLDFSGLGESEGVFADTHFRSMIEDIACAASWLAAHYEPAKCLIGHSMGGTASLAAACNRGASLSQLESVITLASPAEPAHVLHHFGAAMDQLRRGENAQISVAGHLYPVKPEFVEDVESFDMASQMNGCELPILAIRAAADELIDPQNAVQLLHYSKGKTELYQIEGADHLFSNRNHAEQLLSKVLNWLGS